jgi:hypothetical protein
VSVLVMPCRNRVADPTAAETGKTAGVLDGECHVLESSDAR